VKRSLILLLVLLVFVLTSILNVSVMSEVNLTPHEDPAKAESSLDSFSLLMYYSDILMQISIGQYENASMLADSFRFAYVPEELRYIIQRYNDLMLELTQVLNDTENLLTEASTLLYAYRLEEVSRVLNSTGILLGRAGILIRGLEDATATLSSRLRVFASPAESRVRQAYNRLQSMLQRLRLLTEDYRKLLKTLRGEATQIEIVELTPTEITLNLNASSVLVGGFVTTLGSLLSEGKGLAKRAVTILLDGMPVAESLTSQDGWYSATVRIPYKYVNSSNFQAVYLPRSDDRGVYLASRSPPVAIRILFYKTRVGVAIPKEVYPGLPMTIEGEATIMGGVPASLRSVRIFRDGVLLAENQTDLQGRFEVRVVTNPRVPVGKHRLTVGIEPQKVFAGVTYEGELNVVKATSEMSIQVPSILCLPANMYVEGYVYSSFGPVKGALVRLEISEYTITTETLEEGRFEATIYMPLNLVPSGFEELRVSVEPAEPWNAPVQIKRIALVINPANISLMSAAFLSITAALFTNPRKTRLTEETVLTAPIVQHKPEIQVVGSPRSEPAPRPEDARGRVLEAYLRVVEKIVEVTGILMAPYMTLREFLSAVRPNLKDAVDYFADLTLLAERVLYSPYFPEEDQVSKAEGSTERIMKSLKVGSP